MSERPITLVTFDLYDTLIELVPPRWERLGSALSRLDIPCDLEALKAADRIAEDFYTEEATIQPIRDRSAEEREAFRVRYMERWLAAAGMRADTETARTVRRAYLAEFETPATTAIEQLGGGYQVFTDVLPVLERLREAGVKRAVISNADADVTELCTHMAFAHEMNVIITSAVVGWEKPDVRTFQAALHALGVDPADALHIGDQPRSDVVGALDAGMRAALIDRYNRQDPDAFDVPVFQDLDALADHVLAVNAELV